MSTQTRLNNDLLLLLLSETQIERHLRALTSNLQSVGMGHNILTLIFDQTTIMLPLTSTMTWGQLTDSLKKKGLIP